MKSKCCLLQYAKIYYLEEGSGEYVILLPSLWLTSKSYEQLGTKLSAFYHVIIPDLYRGRSQFDSIPSSLDDYCISLRDFIKSLGISKYSLVGFSMSGLIASRYVQIDSKNIHKLIIISTSTFYIKEIAKTSTLLKGTIKLFINNLLSLQGIKINSLYLSDGIEYFFRNPRQFIREIKIGMHEDLEKAGKMTIPTKLFIACEDEFISPEVILAANTNIKNLDIEIIKGKHDWYFHHKNLFLNKTLNFLRNQSPSS